MEHNYKPESPRLRCSVEPLQNTRQALILLQPVRIVMPCTAPQVFRPSCVVITGVLVCLLQSVELYVIALPFIFSTAP